jgi:hypothetical protein
MSGMRCARLAIGAASLAAPVTLVRPGRGRRRHHRREHRRGLEQLLASDLYVLCGLAVLAGAALALTRERAAARAGIDRNRGPSPR